MSSDFYLQATNLLSQILSELPGEEIYTKTACMSDDYRELFGILEGIKKLFPKLKEKIEKIEVLLTPEAKSTWPRSELTDLGLRVGHKNIDETKDTGEPGFDA